MTRGVISTGESFATDTGVTGFYPTLEYSIPLLCEAHVL